MRAKRSRAAMAFAAWMLLAAFSVAQQPAAQAGAALSRELHEALNLAEHGQPRQAYQRVNAMLSAHPNYAPALKLKAMLLEDAGHGEEANASYEAALKITPNDPDLLYKVGVYQLIKGDRWEAIKLLEDDLKYEPKDGDALFYLAQAYHLAGQNDAALKTIKACMEVRKDDPRVWQKYGELLSGTGDNETALEWLGKARKADPSLSRLDYDLAVASFYTMDFDSAKASVEKALGEHPNDSAALALLAAIEVKLAEWGDARQAYAKLLALNSKDVASQLGLGHCELELKNYQQAIEVFRSLLQQDPSVALAHYYLSRAYVALGDSSQAHYEADLHHKLMDAASFVDTALGTEKDRALWEQAKQLLGNGQEESALKLFKVNAEGMQATPGWPYFMVGALHMYLNQPEQGLNDLKTAVKLDPHLRGAHTYMGIYEMQHKEYEQAEREFEAELAIHPNYFTAIAELGSVRYHQQKWNEAIELLTRSHTRSPGLLIELCDAYFKTGNVQDAKLTAEIIVVYARDDQSVLDALLSLLRANQQDELADRIAGARK